MVINFDAVLFGYGFLINSIIVLSLGASLWRIRHLWPVLDVLSRALVVILSFVVFYFVIVGVINLDSTINALRSEPTAPNVWLRHLTRIPSTILALAGVAVYRLTRR